MTETRKISLQFPSLRAFLSEYGARISAEGILLESSPAPAAGEKVLLEVVLAGGMKLLRVQGETVWRGRGGSGLGAEQAAVRFSDLDRASRTLIEKIVDQRRREGGEAFRLDQVAGGRSRRRDLTVAAGDAFPESLALRPTAEAALAPLGDAPPAAAGGPVGGEGPPERTLMDPFPASFRDEVEAELGVPEAEVSFGDLDTSEAEVEPAAAAEAAAAEAAAAGDDADEAPQTEAGEGEAAPIEPVAPIEPAAAAGAEPPEPFETPAAAAEPGRPEPGGEDDAALPHAGIGGDRGEEQREEAADPLVTMPPAPAPPSPAPPPAEPEAETKPPETPAMPPVTPDAAAEGAELLSVPELAAPPSAEGPAADRALAAADEELRGAAGRSHRLGTMLLIGLLAIALLAAGYLFFGFMRKSASPEPAAPSAPPSAVAAPSTEAPAPPPPAADAAAPAGPVAGEVEAPDRQVTTSSDAEVAGEAAAAEPAAGSLRVLERITWSETGSETVLALVGDGGIDESRVQLERLGGEAPRVVLRIAGVERPFQPSSLDVGTVHLVRIRTGLHAGAEGSELHVVLDLAEPAVQVGEPAVRGRRIELRLRSEGG